MRISFDVVIHDLDGEPVIDDTNPDQKKPLQLGVIARNALLASYQDEQGLSGDDKFQRFNLACRTKGEVDWTAEDIALLKKLIAKAYGPLIVGRAFEALERRGAVKAV